MSPLYWFVRYALIIALAGVSTLLAPAIDAISAGWMGRSPVLVAVHDTAVLSTPQAQAGDGSPPLAPSVSVAQHRAFTTVRRPLRNIPTESHGSVRLCWSQGHT
jgi:hypothetical protein